MGCHDRVSAGRAGRAAKVTDCAFEARTYGIESVVAIWTLVPQGTLVGPPGPLDHRGAINRWAPSPRRLSADSRKSEGQEEPFDAIVNDNGNMVWFWIDDEDPYAEKYGVANAFDVLYRKAFDNVLGGQ